MSEELKLTEEQKEEVILSVKGQMILDYGDFREMDPDRKDSFYTFLGILQEALKSC